MNDKAQQALQQYREKVNNGEIAPSERKTLKEKWQAERANHDECHADWQ